MPQTLGQHQFHYCHLVLNIQDTSHHGPTKFISIFNYLTISIIIECRISRLPQIPSDFDCLPIRDHLQAPRFENIDHADQS